MKELLNWLNSYKFQLLLFVAVLIAVILVVRYLKSILSSATSGQDERREKHEEQWREQILALDINQANLRLNRAAYKTLADSIYDELNAWTTNNRKLVQQVEGLNTDELKTVFMDFGWRPSTTLWGMIALTDLPMNLIQWYDQELWGTYLTDMQAIWASSGLWAAALTNTETDSQN